MSRVVAVRVLTTQPVPHGTVPAGERIGSAAMVKYFASLVVEMAREEAGAPRVTGWEPAP
jgi:hypothetical protein